MTDETWVVTGAAGYIGSHVVRSLLGKGYTVVALDSLELGHEGRLPPGVDFRQGRVADVKFLLADLKQGSLEGVVHLAGYKNARESHASPLKYWNNNVGELLSLLDWSTDMGVANFVFSSSSSLYGHQSGVTEASPVQPVSPYGHSKAAGEHAIHDVAAATGMKTCFLRYFNVIGCAEFPAADDRGADNVVPRFVAAAEAGHPMSIYGRDHGTIDGTCVRDYVDVRDLAEAHSLVASRLSKGQDVPGIINVATGHPVSVLDIAKILSDVMAVQHLPLDFRPAHPADPAEVWALPSAALQSWGWSSRYSLRDSLVSHVEARRAAR